eukprot:TRINITY_DN13306_c0_g2_i3.p1 TRINITY_DN13306_c0_g2~~TRINITY_DN13306_c0_g2_i3.p1  ORF type:complete len:196 (+),score=31.19 TRINITY_DN13306_c0_g2_i3:197-784(+)
MKWPMGYGKLTPMGKRQHYLLGRGFRKQYIEDEKFLSDVYNSSEFLVRSTGYERTVISGDSFLKGFYKDNLERLTEDQVKNVKIWVPPIKISEAEKIKRELKMSGLPFDIPVIPVISYNRAYDKLLEWHSCSEYESYWMKYFESDRFQQLYRKYYDSVMWARDMFDLDLDLSSKKKRLHVLFGGLFADSGVSWEA